MSAVPGGRLRILFVLRHPLYLRLYQSLLVMLAERGHVMHLAFTHGYPARDEDVVRDLGRSCPNLTWEYLPAKPFMWRTIGDVPRSVLDYWRYLAPVYEDAVRLRDRARRKVAPGVRFLASHPRLVADGARRQAVSERLRGVERILPVDRSVRALVREGGWDAVLVTPLVDMSYEQLDVVKAARMEGVPSALLVASWDNLTNKGLIHVLPDMVVVWNDAQREEALTLHGVPDERVRVTGAAVYDQWFVGSASVTRAELCARLGLDADAPLITYVGSSGFIARNEPHHVFQWMAHLRNDRRLRHAGIVIRPHPQNASGWSRMELPPGVVVWPPAGAVPLTSDTKADYYDTLFHSDAVVGINTSAFIEAGVMGRRVFAVATPEVRATQEGTLHFRHLVNYGLLEVAPTFQEHLDQLADALEHPDGRADQLAAFLREFVRPAGLEAPATTLLADAVEEVGALPASPWRLLPGAVLFQVLLAPLALLLEFLRHARERLKG
jgi:hypothetical protein